MPAIATISGNFRVTDADRDSDTHHIVLDFGSVHFRYLKVSRLGHSAGYQMKEDVLTMRVSISIASPRNGERPGYDNLAPDGQRVTSDHEGRPVMGVASNFLCDLAKGHEMKVIGPFGSTFLMPDDPASHLLMICTVLAPLPCGR